MILIGNKLKELRKSRGLTQEELGNLLGVAKSSVSMYERDFRRPSYEVLISYVDIFNTSVDSILGSRNQLKDILSRLSYEHRKLVNDFAEFLLSKEQRH